MKKAKLQDYFLWKGELAQVIAEIPTPSIEIQMVEGIICPYCEKMLDERLRECLVIDSPYFQENAEKINTISEDEKEV